MPPPAVLQEALALCSSACDKVCEVVQKLLQPFASLFGLGRSVVCGTSHNAPFLGGIAPAARDVRYPAHESLNTVHCTGCALHGLLDTRIFHTVAAIYLQVFPATHPLVNYCIPVLPSSVLGDQQRRIGRRYLATEGWSSRRLFGLGSPGDSAAGWKQWCVSARIVLNQQLSLSRAKL